MYLITDLVFMVLMMKVQWLVPSCYVKDLDGINNESRATGSSNFTIKRGIISLLGASNGDKLWMNTYRFANDSGCDGVAVRFTYHILPLLSINELPIDYFVLLPNLVHLSIFVIILSKKHAHMVFRQLFQDIENRPPSKSLYFYININKTGN